MPRRNLLPHFSRIRALKLEIDEFVPGHYTKAVTFRADLAGLLVVLIAATYESCVKDSLNTFAAGRHKSFGDYTDRSYAKLNSRIQVSDLNRYSILFDAAANNRFKAILSKKKDHFNMKLGRNIEGAYKQILDWRHDFAHQGTRNTTVEEAYETHHLGKHVLYCFEEALNGR